MQHACLMLGVSVSGYYDWKLRPPAARTLRHAWLAGEIAQVHKDSAGTYGKLRITAELRYGRGIHVGKEQVGLVMKRLGIYGLPKRRLPRGAKVGKASSLDLVRRRFGADGPDRLWMTDITEHPTREGKIYCCAVIDAFSRMVVGWSIDSRQTGLLVTNALGMRVLMYGARRVQTVPVIEVLDDLAHHLVDKRRDPCLLLMDCCAEHRRCSAGDHDQHRRSDARHEPPERTEPPSTERGLKNQTEHEHSVEREADGL